jgi:hypothetical protein
MKTQVRSKKPRRCDIKWSNTYGNQTTYFINCTKSLNAENSCCNHKKTKITSNAKFIICISSTNEMKTQIRWAIVVGQRT